MIDAVIFDKDGTLFDFRQSWGAVAERVLIGLSRDDSHAVDLAAVMGYDRAARTFLPDSPMIAGTAAEIAAAMLPLLPETTLTGLQAYLNREAVSAPMHAAVDLVQVLGALKARGLRLGLATNDTEAPARAHLAEAGITHMFDFIAGCDSGHGAKPEPGMLLAFARDLGLTADRIVMVGDSLHDLVAGRAAGMRVAGVLTGIADRTELGPFADVVLQDIGDLAQWIDSLPQD